MALISLRLWLLGALVAAHPVALSADEHASPAGAVSVEIHEPFTGDAEWDLSDGIPTDTYKDVAFAFFRFPPRYTESGVRADRANPFLLRASGTVTLDAGDYRILLRSRSAARLWADGVLLAETPFKTRNIDGHDPVEKLPEKVGPDVRWLGPGDQEILVAFTAKGGPHRFLLETVVGGKKLRAELGETSVSVSRDGANFHILAPRQSVPLTDEGWRRFREDGERHYDKLDAQRRRAAAANDGDYWKRRHREAAGLAKTFRPPVPEAPTTANTPQAIDRFINARLDRSRQQATANDGRGESDAFFHREVWPILQQSCGKCHGDKAKGGLRLDSRAGLQAGGDSGLPVVVEGHPRESLLFQLVNSEDDTERMPPKGRRLSEAQTAVLHAWIARGAPWPEEAEEVCEGPVRTAPLTDDLAFLRRVTLDTVGMVPTLEEIRAFEDDRSPEKRNAVIDRLLGDERRAGHWVSYWQDVLAENPSILKPSLNNTGPFRWWLHESLLDNKPMDRLVTELILMEGSAYDGGPAGFGLAKENDVPMAAKAHVLGTAFLGVEMKCARCHDAPYHSVNQEDLFAMAAMLKRAPLEVPASSSVPAASLEGRQALIQVTLAAGSEVAPAWPFPKIIEEQALADDLLRDPGDSRQRLAALVTAPANRRFARVLANRVWKRLLGRGLVSSADDWENTQPSHPELLDYLAAEFMATGYDLEQLCRLILRSEAYQRSLLPDRSAAEERLFASPPRRRLTAEQIVDSSFLVCGKKVDSEPLNMDVDGGRDAATMLNLGQPQRAWEFVSLSNERDRPALAMPRAQAVVDVLSAFGWRSSRPHPLTDREIAPNVLQPAIFANGPMGRRITGLSDDSRFTSMALGDLSLDALIDRVFLTILTRYPQAEEKAEVTRLLERGYEDRRLAVSSRDAGERRPQRSYREVSWSNHLSPEATRLKQAQERAALEGDPPTRRLDTDWRRRLEDVVWALVNSPEMIFVP